MNKIINGHQIAQQIQSQISQKITALKAQNRIPQLGIILVGADARAKIYVEQKEKLAQTLGIKVKKHLFDAHISQPELIQKINQIQTDDAGGLVIQLPLPQHLETDAVLNQLDPNLDVDCLTSFNLGKLMIDDCRFRPPTGAAIMHILDHLKVKLKGALVTIVGAGRLVGRPLTIMMMNAGATVTVSNEFTPDLKKITGQADVLISAAGKKGLITGEIIKPGAIVIDAGTSIEHGRSFGDIDLESVAAKAKYVTPTPGGVGPLTVAYLLWNVVNVM